MRFDKRKNEEKDYLTKVTIEVIHRYIYSKEEKENFAFEVVFDLLI